LALTVESEALGGCRILVTPLRTREEVTGHQRLASALLNPEAMPGSVIRAARSEAHQTIVILGLGLPVTVTADVLEGALLWYTVPVGITFSDRIPTEAAADPIARYTLYVSIARTIW